MKGTAHKGQVVLVVPADEALALSRLIAMAASFADRFDPIEPADAVEIANVSAELERLSEAARRG